MGTDTMCKKCGCVCHNMTPVLVTLFGLLFLLSAWGAITAEFTSYAWPVLVMLAGLTKLMSNKCKCC